MSSSLASLTATSGDRFGPVGRGVRHVLRAMVALRNAAANRRAVTEMLELDERMLKDIGLVRSDVLGALAGPLTYDPSTVLRLRSVDRRARQRAMEASTRRVTAVEPCY